jgi:hypothetical protein
MTAQSLILLCAAVAGQAAAVAGDADTAPVITLYVGFEQQAPPGALLAQAQAEASTVLAPAGVNFEWRSLDDPRSGQPVEELVVVRFKGRCQAVPGVRPQNAYGGALGWTHISDGEVLPFSDIDCDRTWALIQQQLGGEPEAEHDRILGRALGRVLAHELYHIFANTTRHTASGLSKACYTAAELADGVFRFQSEAFAKMRAGKFARLFKKNRPASDATGAGDGGGQ